MITKSTAVSRIDNRTGSQQTIE